jgi:anaerobic selenocysteine-containing dehydrogenase
MINENLVDQAFLDTYCIGYDEKTLPADAPANGHYKAYILGNGDDGIAKTPQWASHVTGIPPIALSNWLGKSAAQNRHIFVRVGVRNVRLTAN